MIKKIQNITIFVTDLKKAVSFYENILGLVKKYEFPTYVAFDVAGVELGLQPDARARGRKEGAPAILLLVDDVDAAYQTLKDKGVTFITEPEDKSWGGREAGFLDPDKNVFWLLQMKQ